MPKNQDPKKPKGKCGAFNYFAQDRRKVYIKNFEEQGKPVDYSGFPKECSQLWRDMKDKGKAKYLKLADLDRIRYEKEMAEYELPTKAKGRSSRPSKGKTKKDPNMPKRCKSAFIWFSGEKRAEVKERLDPGAGIGDVAKELGGLWRGMTPKEKAPFEVLAKKDRERYSREMEVYREKEADEEEEEESDE